MEFGSVGNGECGSGGYGQSAGEIGGSVQDAQTVLGDGDGSGCDIDSALDDGSADVQVVDGSGDGLALSRLERDSDGPAEGDGRVGACSCGGDGSGCAAVGDELGSGQGHGSEGEGGVISGVDGDGQGAVLRDCESHISSGDGSGDCDCGDGLVDVGGGILDTGDDAGGESVDLLGEVGSGHIGQGQVGDAVVGARSLSGDDDVSGDHELGVVLLVGFIGEHDHGPGQLEGTCDGQGDLVLDDDVVPVAGHGGSGGDGHVLLDGHILVEGDGGHLVGDGLGQGQVGPGGVGDDLDVCDGLLVGARGAPVLEDHLSVHGGGSGVGHVSAVGDGDGDAGVDVERGSALDLERVGCRNGGVCLGGLLSLDDDLVVDGGGDVLDRRIECGVVVDCLQILGLGLVVGGVEDSSADDEVGLAHGDGAVHGDLGLHGDSGVLVHECEGSGDVDVSSLEGECYVLGERHVSDGDLGGPGGIALSPDRGGGVGGDGSADGHVGPVVPGGSSLVELVDDLDGDGDVLDVVQDNLVALADVSGIHIGSGDRGGGSGVVDGQGSSGDGGDCDADAIVDGDRGSLSGGSGEGDRSHVVDGSDEGSVDDCGSLDDELLSGGSGDCQGVVVGDGGVCGCVAPLEVEGGSGLDDHSVALLVTGDVGACDVEVGVLSGGSGDVDGSAVGDGHLSVDVDVARHVHGGGELDGSGLVDVDVGSVLDGDDAVDLQGSVDVDLVVAADGVAAHDHGVAVSDVPGSAGLSAQVLGLGLGDADVSGSLDDRVDIGVVDVERGAAVHDDDSTIGQDLCVHDVGLDHVCSTLTDGEGVCADVQLCSGGNDERIESGSSEIGGFDCDVATNHDVLVVVLQSLDEFCDITGRFSSGSLQHVVDVDLCVQGDVDVVIGACRQVEPGAS